jgi:hypothetical protein
MKEKNSKKWEIIEKRFDKAYTPLLIETYKSLKKEYDPNIAYSFFHKIKKVVYKEILLAEQRCKKAANK